MFIMVQIKWVCRCRRMSKTQSKLTEYKNVKEARNDSLPHVDFGQYDSSDRADEMDSTRKEVMESIVDDIVAGGESERFKQIIESFGLLADYSWNNKMLIRMQNPDAVGPFTGPKQWINNFGRVPKKGSSVSWILYPARMTTYCADCNSPARDCNPLESDECEPVDPNTDRKNPRNKNTYKTNPSYFRWGKTLGYNQTVEMPDEQKPDNVADISTLVDRDAETDLETDELNSIINKLTHVCQKNGVDVTICTDPSEWDGSESGFYSPRDDSIAIRGFVLDDDSTERPLERQVSTLIHETAHAIMHKDTSDSDISTRQIELEAEAVTKSVCDMIGVETTSGVYIATHIRNECDINNRDEIKSTVKSSFNRIESASSILMNALNEY